MIQIVLFGLFSKELMSLKIILNLLNVEKNGLNVLHFYKQL